MTTIRKSVTFNGYALRCDTCGKETVGAALTEDDAADSASAAGWAFHDNPDRDECASCRMARKRGAAS